MGRDPLSVAQTNDIRRLTINQHRRGYPRLNRINPLYSHRLRRPIKLLALLALLAVVAYFAADEPLPQGHSGPDADALARKIQNAVNVPAWRQTGAVRWTFANRHHLWDRQRGLARIQWDNLEIQLDLEHHTGLAWRSGQSLDGDERAELIATAHSYWINDSFWLNPLAKLFDLGTTRQLVVQPDGSEDLLLTYTSGGDTPGDSYLWQVSPDGRPHTWRMWVSIIPVGGVKASWQQWMQLETGAWISKSHRLLFFDLELKNVAGAESITALAGNKDALAAIAMQRH